MELRVGKVTKWFGLFLLVAVSPVCAAGGFTWVGSIIDQFHLPVAEHVLTFALVGILLTACGLVYRAKLASVSNVIIPDEGITFRNIMEMYGSFVYAQCRAVIGEDKADEYFSFVSIIFLVILSCNLLGLIPGFLPPTEYLTTTLALGLFSFVYYNIKGCKEQGVVNYLKHFAGPLWYMAFIIFPIEIISNAIRPISLGLRLRFNIMGDHLVLSEFSKLVPVILPVVFMLLGILVSFIQAYVFTVLSMVYISLAVSHHDHDEEHAH